MRINQLMLSALGILAVVGTLGCGDNVTSVELDAGNIDANDRADANNIDAMPATPVVQFAELSSSVAEADGTLIVAVALSVQVPTTEAITVQVSLDAASVAIAPDDFGIDVSEVTFPIGSNDGDTQNVTLTLVNDALVEGDEDVGIQLSTPIGADLGVNTNHASTIIDSDTASVAFSAANFSTPEINGSTSVNVVLTTAGPSGAATLSAPLTIEFADVGTGTAMPATDYAIILSGIVTFDSGATDLDEALVQLEVFADLESETDETINLALTSPLAPLTLGAIAAASVSILDDDNLVTGNGANVFTIDQVDPSSALTVGSRFGFSGTNDPEGSAYDSINNLLYIAGDSTEDALYVYNPVTKSIAMVGQFGLEGFPAVESLTFDPNTQTLYGVDDTSDSLLNINMSTGKASVVGAVGSLGPSTIEGLAFDSITNVLYGSDDGTNELVTIDTITGTLTVVGAFGADGTSMESLTFDSTSNTLYGVNESGIGSLVSINTTTGLATLIAAINGNDSSSWDVQGIAFDTTNNRMYGVEGQFETVLTIDVASAAVVVDGLTSFKDFDALTFDPTNNRILAVLEFDDYLVEINLTTGEPRMLTRIDQSFTPSINAMAFDSVNNVLYVEDGADLFTLDMGTGAGTLIGDIQVGTTNRNLTALVFDGSGTLWGMDSDELFTIDTATGAATLIGDTNLFSFDGLAWDNTNNILYATRTTNELYTLDSTNAVPTLVGELGADNWDDLTIDPATGTLYSWDNDRDVLIRLDEVSLSITTIGSVGVNADALAFDPATGIYYASDFLQRWLFTVDFTNNTATSIGPFGVAIHGMVFDPATSTLLGASNDDELVTIDQLTGALTILGTTESGIEALCIDSVNNVLYGSNQTDLFSISTTDGASTLLGPHGTFTDVRGLGFDSVHGVLYGSDVQQKAILQIDTVSGAATMLRPSRNTAPFSMTFARP